MPPPTQNPDDRLRAVETEQAEHSAKLEAGVQMFEAIQQNIQMLHQDVTEMASRMEHGLGQVVETVRDLSKQMADVRVEQAKQGVELAAVKDKSKQVTLLKRFRPYAIGAVGVGLVTVGAVGGRPAIEAIVRLLVSSAK